MTQWPNNPITQVTQLHENLFLYSIHCLHRWNLSFRRFIRGFHPLFFQPLQPPPHPPLRDPYFSTYLFFHAFKIQPNKPNQPNNSFLGCWFHCLNRCHCRWNSPGLCPWPWCFHHRRSPRSRWNYFSSVYRSLFLWETKNYKGRPPNSLITKLLNKPKEPYKPNRPNSP